MIICASLPAGMNSVFDVAPKVWSGLSSTAKNWVVAACLHEPSARTEAVAQHNAAAIDSNAKCLRNFCIEPPLQALNMWERYKTGVSFDKSGLARASDKSGAA